MNKNELRKFYKIVRKNIQNKEEQNSIILNKVIANKKVLDRLKKYNVKVYRTDIDGEIKLKIKNNGKISLNVMNKKRETN